MTEIEKLRADIETLEAAQKVCLECSWGINPELQHRIAEKQQELAKLEADAAAAADPWANAKERLALSEINPAQFSDSFRILAKYARHLERVESVLTAAEVSLCERVAELEAELAKRPVVYVARLKEDGMLQTWACSCGTSLPVLYHGREINWRRTTCSEAMNRYCFEPFTGELS